MKFIPTKSLITFLAILIISIPLLLVTSLPAPVHAAASLALNPASGFVGSTVQVSGKGFSGRLATIYFDDKKIAANIAISETGDLNYGLNIPNTYKGTHIIRIADNSNWAASSAIGDFVVLTQVTAFPAIATGTSEITLTGNGFNSSEKDIKITWDGNVASMVPITADRLGTWSIIFAIPKTTKGEHYISASSSATSASEISKVKFIVAPYVKVTPLSGPVGTQIMFYGWGFRANEDGVSMTWDGEIIVVNIRAELDGSLIVDGSKVPNPSSAYTGDTRETIYVPPSTQGRHIIGVYGSSFTPRGTFNDNVFEVIPDIKLQTEPNIKGTQVTINGTGFASNEIITVSLDKMATNTTVTTDTTGSFTTILVIPTSKGKEYNISVSGNKGNTAQANFSSATDKSIATEVKLLAPIQGASLTIFGSVGDVLSGIIKYLFGVFDYLKGSQPKALNSPQFTFTWTSDGSAGTSYVFQVASDRNFSSIALEKKLNRSEYTLIENDHLTSGHYNWRVKAIDYADHDGQWSKSSEFEIASMSTLVGILTSVILVLIVAAIGFGIFIAWVNLKQR